MRPFKKSKSKRDAKGGAAGAATAGVAYKPSGPTKKLGLNEEEDSRVQSILGPLLVYLRAHALDTDNLFMRVGGSDPDADMYTYQMAAKDLLRSRDAPEQVLPKFDVHVWANVSKLLLKEMNRPLIPHHISEIFLSRDFELGPSGGITPEVIRLVKEILEDIPHKEYNGLRDLCALLRDCMTDQDRLAHMFGAILLDPPNTTGFMPDPQVMMKQAKNTTTVMKCLIVHASEVFGVAPPTRTSPPSQFLSVDQPAGMSGPGDGGGEFRGRIYSFDMSSPTPMVAAGAAGAAFSNEAPRADGKISRFVTVRYEHHPEEDDELYLYEGEQVKIIGQVNKDWYTGLKTHPDGRTEVGIFPGSYCGLEGTEEFIESLEEEDAGAAPANAASSALLDLASASADLSRASHVVALYDYAPREQGEMAITEGQRIRLISTLDPDWWFGASEDGREGLFPRTYVGPAPGATLRSEAAPPTKPRTSSGAQSAVVVGDLLVASRTPASASAAPTPSAPAPAPPRRTTSLQDPSASAKFKMKPLQPPQPPASDPVKKWPVTKDRFKLCTKNFNKLKKELPGGSFVTGKDASEFLLRSQLPKATIARILELADIDGDHRLDLDEFVVAHHLAISIARESMPEPSVLPDYLIPTTKRHLSV